MRKYNMGSFIDMTGWKMWEHGVPESKLTVIRQAQDRIQSNGIHIKRWIVECNCEKHTIFEVDGRSIKSGNTTSCGCTRGYNKYDLTNEYGIGITSNSNEEFYFSLDKYDLIKDYVWRVTVDKRNGYKRLVTSIHYPDGKCKIKTIWSMITGYDYCDHKNGNTLDNRNENLRQSTHLLNMQNRKTHKNNKTTESGIDNVNSKYSVHIRYNNQEYNLGTYNDFDTALMVRIRAEAAVFDQDYAPHRNLFDQYNINIEEEKEYWNTWISKTGINYLGYPIHWWQKMVVQLTLDGKYIKIFESMKIAADETGACYSAIQSCCNHKSLSAGGYIWVFEDEYKPEEVAYSYNPNINNKAVVKLSLSGVFIERYETITYASHCNNINPSCICACCKGRQRTAGGFVWMYENEYLELNNYQQTT